MSAGGQKKLYPYLLPFLRRFLILSVVSTMIMLVVSEISYLLQGSEAARDPMVVELTIPSGTADIIAQGKPNPAIPDELVFVVGDTLLVHNQDVADHELGPLWIPAGTSASMTLEEANAYTYSCTFQSNQYLDLTVIAPVDWQDRLQALWYGTPPTVMFLLVYSFIVRPLKPSQPRLPAQPA